MTTATPPDEAPPRAPDAIVRSTRAAALAALPADAEVARHSGARLIPLLLPLPSKT